MKFNFTNFCYIFIIVFFLVDELTESKICYQGHVYVDWNLTFKCNNQDFKKIVNCWPWITIRNVSIPTHHYYGYGSAAWGNGFFTKVTIDHNCSTNGNKCSFWPPEPTYSCRNTKIPKWNADMKSCRKLDSFP
uniref:Uncharacterized protein n=1 Tax=Parastrongyloides trichosuri TaxID=131310 RepID=A0A0N5A715_PARTI